MPVEWRSLRRGGGTSVAGGRWTALVLAAALVANLALLVLYHRPEPKRLRGDELYYAGLATDIAAGRVARHAPMWPPFYGELLGGIFRVTGGGRLAVQLLQVGFWLAGGLLLRGITARLVPSAAVADTAMALYFLSPELMAFSHYFWPETFHLGFWLGALWLVVRHPRPWWSPAACGVLLGLALLTKSLLLPVVPILLLFIVLIPVPGLGAGARLARAALAAAALSVTVLPVALDSYRSRGTPMIADSSVFNLWVGLNDRSRVDYRGIIVGRELKEFEQSDPDPAVRNEIYRRRIGELVERQGMIGTLRSQIGRQYFRLFDFQTFFTTQLPGGPRGAYAFDSRPLVLGLKLWSAASYGLVLIAGACGLAFLAARPVGWVQFLALFILYNLGIFLLLHAKSRYVLQFLPVLMIFGAIAIHRLAALLRGTGAADWSGFAFSRRRAAAAIVFGVVMAGLVFRSALARVLA